MQLNSSWPLSLLRKVDCGDARIRDTYIWTWNCITFECKIGTHFIFKKSKSRSVNYAFINQFLYEEEAKEVRRMLDETLAQGPPG